jgi:kynurenine formamidase
VRATVWIGERAFRWDPDVYHDLARPLRFDGRDDRAFGLPSPRVRTVSGEHFHGKVAEGGPVNCSTIDDLNPHTVTHVEGLGHLRAAGEPVAAILTRCLHPARVLTVPPTLRPDGGRVIEADSVARGLRSGDPFLEAVVLRTRTRPPGAAGFDFTGTSPPFLAPEAAAWLRRQGTRLLAIDLPSLDPEVDEGRLGAHRAFLGEPEAAIETERAVCELIQVPEEVADGPYLLLLVPLRWEMDATPVRPLLFPVEA